MTPPPASQPPAAMVVPAFFVKQRITLMVNRYEILAVNPDGSEGQLLALAEQKRMKLKEEVTFYADAAKTRPVFSFKARQRLDVRAEHDVYDEQGNALGMFRKQFGASLLRSTWKLEQPGYGEMIGQERNIWVAVLRRFVESLSWLPYHFDFTLGGHPA